jgi:hypothetical protein
MSTPSSPSDPRIELNREDVVQEAYRLSMARAERGEAADAVADWFEAEAVVRARMETRREELASAARRVMTVEDDDGARPATAKGREAAKRAKAAKAAKAAKSAKPSSKEKSASATRGGGSKSASKKSGRKK